jgi:hypothetical protein
MLAGTQRSAGLCTILTVACWACAGLGRPRQSSSSLSWTLPAQWRAHLRRCNCTETGHQDICDFYNCTETGHQGSGHLQQKHSEDCYPSQGAMLRSCRRCAASSTCMAAQCMRRDLWLLKSPEQVHQRCSRHLPPCGYHQQGGDAPPPAVSLYLPTTRNPPPPPPLPPSCRRRGRCPRVPVTNRKIFQRQQR